MIQPVGAQITGRAVAATIAFDAVVAGERFGAYQFKFVPVVRQRPGLGFIEPHQRRFKANIFRHAQTDRMVQRLHELIATVRITGEVGLAYAGDDGFRLHLIGINSCQRQEQNIASRYKGIWNAVGIRFVVWHGNTVASQAADRQFIEQGDVQHFMRASAQRQRQFTGNVNFSAMALAIIKRDAVNFIILMQRLHQACCGILSTAKDDNGTFHGFSCL